MHSSVSYLLPNLSIDKYPLNHWSKHPDAGPESGPQELYMCLIVSNYMNDSIQAVL